MRPKLPRPRLASAAIVVLTFLSGGAAIAKSPGEFLQDAIKGDNSEVALGRLATKSAASPGVRQYGETLMPDHAQAKKEAAAVARQIGMQVPDELNTEAKKEMNKLNGESGSKFDKEFVSYMIKDHTKDISEFQKQAGSGTGPTAELAKKQLPALRKHLDMAKSLESKL